MDLNQYSKEYLSNDEKSYLTFTIPVAIKMKQYQTGMLDNNRIDTLLPMSIQRMNDDWMLSYDITSRIPLNKVLERKSFSTGEFEFIISQFSRLIRQLKDYLLDLSSVVLDCSLIFCDPSSLTLFFLYFPVQTEENKPENVKDFFRKLIIEDIRLSEDSSGSLLKRMLDTLKAEPFSPEKLCQCVQGRETKIQTESPQWNQTEQKQKMYPSQETKCSSEITVPGSKPNRMAIPKLRSEENVKKTSQASTALMNPDQLPYPILSYLVTGAINLASVIILAVILASAKEGSTNTGSNILGLLLITAALNYFLITRMFSKEKRRVDPVKNDTVNRVQEKPVQAKKRFVNTTLEEDIILPGLISKSTERVPDIKSHIQAANHHEGLSMKKEIGTDDHEKVMKDLYLEDSLVAIKQKSNESLNSDVYIADFGTKSTDERIEMKASLENKLITNPKGIQPKISGPNLIITDKTLVLGSSKGITPFLQSHSNPSETIRLEKNKILLGRLADTVDYTIHNHAVGKMHAEIIHQDDAYYIIDLNSVNGTYINGERITCNTATRMQNGDRITLANEQYTFID